MRTETGWIAAACLFAGIIEADILLSPQQVDLVWDAVPGEDTNGLWFQVHATTNVTLPLTNWPVLTNVPAPVAYQGTNGPHIRLTVIPGACFYAVTASNLWGVSPFSNVARTPSVPLGSDNLRVRRSQ